MFSRSFRGVDEIGARSWRVLAAGRDLTLAAAEVKAQHGMPYADAFAAGAAVLTGAPLATGDPELLVPAAPWSVIDLREG